MVRQRQNKSRRRRVLFVVANPEDTTRLKVAKEVREVRESIKRARLSSRFRINEVLEARFKDLRRALLEFKPHIVHFSGHGTPGGLILVGEDDKAEILSGEVLAELLAEFPGIECVVLNNCYSVEQAKALVEKTDIQYVIATEKAISDEAAIAFAEGFYDALGNGEDCSKAFRLGKVSALQKQPNVLLRLFWRKGERTVEAFEAELLEIVSATQSLLNNCIKLSKLYAAFDQEEVASRLQQRVDELNNMVTSPLRVHVALVGVSGVGKTTLLNALVGKKVAIGGGGAAQSAAVISLEHRPISRFEVTIHYLSLNSLISLLSEAHFQLSYRDLSRLPDQQGLTKDLRMLLNVLNLTPGDIVSLDLNRLNAEELLHMLPFDIRSRIGKEEQRVLGESDLLLFVGEHTNTSGQFWPITDFVEIKGPFPNIPPNVVLFDLPGLGDLSKIRITRAKKYLREANQLLLVVGERGINHEVWDFLASLDIVSTILTHDRIPQVTIIGSRLDQIAVSFQGKEKERFGITDDMSDEEVLGRIFEKWKGEAQDNWRDVLLQWGERTLQGKARKGLQDRVDRIIANTRIIPAVPLLYLRAIGIEPRERWGLQIWDEDLTGIPSIRRSLQEALSSQEKLKAIRIQNEAESLREESLRLASAFVEELQKDINTAQNEIEFWKAFARGLRSGIVWHLTSVPTHELRENAQRDFLKGWKDLSPDALRKVFEEEGYVILYYQTLMAAFRRRGKYTSRGKARTKINIPSKLRHYISGQMFLTVKGYSKKALEDLAYQANKESRNFCKALKDTASAICVSLLNMSAGEIETFSPMSTLHQILEEHKREVRDAIAKVLEFDEVVWDEIIDEAIGYGMQSVFEGALREKGRGARARALERIYQSAPERLPEIAAKASYYIEEQMKEWLDKKRRSLREEISKIEKGTIRRIRQYKKLVVSSQQKQRALKPYISQAQQVLSELEQPLIRQE